MNIRILDAIKLLQSRLNKGDQIIVEKDEFRVVSKDEVPHCYVNS
jgi:hypothetical protein